MLCSGALGSVVAERRGICSKTTPSASLFPWRGGRAGRAVTALLGVALNWDPTDVGACGLASHGLGLRSLRCSSMVSPVEGNHPPQGTGAGETQKPPSRRRLPLKVTVGSGEGRARGGWRPSPAGGRHPLLLPRGARAWPSQCERRLLPRFVSRPLSSSSSALPETPDLCWVITETLQVGCAIELGPPGSSPSR